MALNQEILEKLAHKSGDDQATYKAMVELLEAKDEGKQLKKILESHLKSI